MSVFVPNGRGVFRLYQAGELCSADVYKRQVPVYPLTAGLTQRDLERVTAAALVLVNRIRIVLTGYRLVGRDFDNVQLIGVDVYKRQALPRPA